MYEQVFHFRSRPFTTTPFVKHYFAGSAIQQALGQTQLCVDRASGPVVVIGDIGTGKSLFMAMLEQHYKSSFLVVNLACARLETRKDLLQSILFALDRPIIGRTESELRFDLMAQVKPNGKHANGMLLLVDDAENLSIDLIDELRLITNNVVDGVPRVRLVMAGRQGLEEQLADPRVASLVQRIASRCYLAALSKDETAAYVAAHIARAGGEPQQLFPQETLSKIFECTYGVPRLINQVADFAMIIAATRGEKSVSPQVLEEAWNDVQSLPGILAPSPNQAVADGNSEWTVVEFGSLDDDGDGTVYEFGAAKSDSTSSLQPDASTTSQIETESLANVESPSLDSGTDEAKAGTNDLAQTPVLSKSPEQPEIDPELGIDLGSLQRIQELAKRHQSNHQTSEVAPNPILQSNNESIKEEAPSQPEPDANSVEPSASSASSLSAELAAVFGLPTEPSVPANLSQGVEDPSGIVESASSDFSNDSDEPSAEELARNEELLNEQQELLDAVSTERQTFNAPNQIEESVSENVSEPSDEAGSYADPIAEANEAIFNWRSEHQSDSMASTDSNEPSSRTWEQPCDLEQPSEVRASMDRESDNTAAVQNESVKPEKFQYDEPIYLNPTLAPKQEANDEFGNPFQPMDVADFVRPREINRDTETHRVNEPSDHATQSDAQVPAESVGASFDPDQSQPVSEKLDIYKHQVIDPIAAEPSRQETDSTRLEFDVVTTAENDRVENPFKITEPSGEKAQDVQPPTNASTEDQTVAPTQDGQEPAEAVGASEFKNPFAESFAQVENVYDRFAPFVAEQNYHSSRLTSSDLAFVTPLDQINDPPTDQEDVWVATKDANQNEGFGFDASKQVADDFSSFGSPILASDPADSVIDSERETSFESAASSESNPPNSTPVDQHDEAKSEFELTENAPVWNQATTESTPPRAAQPSVRAVVRPAAPSIALEESQKPVAAQPKGTPNETSVSTPDEAKPEPASSSFHNHVTEATSEEISRQADEILKRLNRNRTADSQSVPHETHVNSDLVTSTDRQPTFSQDVRSTDSGVGDPTEDILNEINEQREMLNRSQSSKANPFQIRVQEYDEPAGERQAEQPREEIQEDEILSPLSFKSNQNKDIDEASIQKIEYPLRQRSTEDGESTAKHQDDGEMIFVTRTQNSESNTEPKDSSIPIPNTPVSTGKAVRMDYQQLFDQLRNVSQQPPTQE